jgi:hypothetical protein
MVCVRERTIHVHVTETVRMISSRSLYSAVHTHTRNIKYFQVFSSSEKSQIKYLGFTERIQLNNWQAKVNPIEFYRGISHFLQTNARTVPRIGHDRFLPNLSNLSFYLSATNQHTLKILQCISRKAN